jgi:hypothetical protein
MYLLFEVASKNSIFGALPESLEVLVFGIALIFLAVGLRSILKRGESGSGGKIIHKTK